MVRAGMATRAALATALATALAGSAQGRGPEDGCVVVTGATGFVAGHVVKDLLEKGYTVHGTVRSLADTGKSAHLRKMADAAPGSLKLFEASLGKDGAFDEAASGCWGMLHLASVVVPQGESPEEQVRLAVDGTLSALEASKKNGLKKVVVTASTATVYPNKVETGKPRDESSWNDVATLNYGTYSYSKVEAERAALSWYEENGADAFSFATVHFPVALGPQLGNRVTSTLKYVHFALTNQIPYGVIFHRINLVDVRDVAAAHVAVLESDTASGRYIVANDRANGSSLSIADLATVLARKFPRRFVETREMPAWLASLLSNVHPQIDPYNLDISLSGLHPGYVSDKLAREVGYKVRYTDPERTIVDTAESLIKLNMVGDGRRNLAPLGIAAGTSVFVVVMVLALCCAAGSSKGPSGKKED